MSRTAPFLACLTYTAAATLLVIYSGLSSRILSVITPLATLLFPAPVTEADATNPAGLTFLLMVIPLTFFGAWLFHKRLTSNAILVAVLAGYFGTLFTLSALTG